MIVHPIYPAIVVVRMLIVVVVFVILIRLSEGGMTYLYIISPCPTDEEMLGS